MPSEEWKSEHPKVSAYLPKKIYNELKTFMAERGIKTVSQSVETILSEFLGSSLNNTFDSETENRIKTIEKEILDIKAQLNGNKVDYSSSLKASKVVYPVAQSSLLSKNGKWLTTGEAHAEMQSRGYTKSIGTFRRSLRGGVIPAALEQIGLEADWSVRNQANQKDNSVRWLRFK
jgi:predicted DNA-binding protein (UPF0278 family)